MFFGFEPDNDVEYFAIYGGDCFFDALAAIALAAIAKFHRLMGAGGGAGGNSGAAKRAVFQPHIHFHRGIAAAVEDFSGGDIDNGGHGLSPGCAPLLGHGSPPFKTGGVRLGIASRNHWRCCMILE